MVVPFLEQVSLNPGHSKSSQNIIGKYYFEVAFKSFISLQFQKVSIFGSTSHEIVEARKIKCEFIKSLAPFCIFHTWLTFTIPVECKYCVTQTPLKSDAQIWAWPAFE